MCKTLYSLSGRVTLRQRYFCKPTATHCPPDLMSEMQKRTKGKKKCSSKVKEKKKLITNEHVPSQWTLDSCFIVFKCSGRSCSWMEMRHKLAMGNLKINAHFKDDNMDRFLHFYDYVADLNAYWCPGDCEIIAAITRKALKDCRRVQGRTILHKMPLKFLNMLFSYSAYKLTKKWDWKHHNLGGGQ